MNDPYQIVFTPQPEWDIIGQGITDYNTSQAGDDRGQNLCFVVKAPDGSVAGGVIAAVYWDWLFVNLMWLKEDLRQQGYGSRLLALVEEEARRRGATRAYLDTFSFQAPEFYKKHGYQVFGQLADFPKGHTRYFLAKTL